MSFQPGANLYTQGFGSKSENVEVPHIEKRNPSPTDINYPVGKTWLNTVSATQFILYGFTSANGVTSANWDTVSLPSGGLDTLSNGTILVDPDGSGNISITGTSNEITVTSNPGSNNLTLSLASSLILPGDLTVDGNLTVDLNTTLNQNLHVVQQSSLDGGLEVTGHTSISGGAIDIESGGAELTLNTTSIGNISIGQTTGAQITTILGGSGGVNIDSVAGSTIKISNTLFTTSSVNIGNSNTPTVEIAGQHISAFTYGSGIDINSLGGGDVSINTGVAADTTIGLSGAGSHNTSLYAGDTGSILIGDIGNQSIQIGNISGTESTSIDGGTTGVFILNPAGNSNTLVVGPYLPNGTSGNIELNAGDNGGKILLNGGQSVVVSSTSTSNTSISVSKFFIPCDSTAGAFTITLPGSPQTGQHFVIADISGTAVANNITINGNGHNINGSATSVLNQAYARADLYYTGSVWSR